MEKSEIFDKIAIKNLEKVVKISLYGTLRKLGFWPTF